MLALYDKVLHIPSGKPCFITYIDEGDKGAIYGLEAEDLEDPDWFYWADEDEVEKLPEEE